METRLGADNFGFKSTTQGWIPFVLPREME